MTFNNNIIKYNIKIVQLVKLLILQNMECSAINIQQKVKNIKNILAFVVYNKIANFSKQFNKQIKMNLKKCYKI